MHTLLTVLLATLVSLASYAGVVDHDRMYRAFLDNDMDVWRVELKRYSAQTELTDDDKLDLCNYIYGYVATILETQPKDTVEQWLALWEGYLDQLTDPSVESSVLVYRSSAAAYRAMLYPGKMIVLGPKSIRLLDKALDADPANPLAIGLRGNMKFYLPAIGGGDKQLAIKLFHQAIDSLLSDSHIRYRWNICSMQLCLAQSYQKLNDHAAARAVAEQTLAREPRYKYMKEVFLPQLP